MTIESRIAALKTALAEKYANPAGLSDVSRPVKHHMKMATEHFLAGASALADVYRLEGKLKALGWVEDHLDDLGMEQSKMLWRKQEEAQAQLEALLKQMEEKV